MSDKFSGKSEILTPGESPVIVAFLCTWCSYAGADLAGTGRNQYPPNIRVIRVPCSGRINPLYIVKALLEGADGVMVSGCHPGDCHYLVGNYYARRRFTVLKKLLETAGFESDRVVFTWVSASEGIRFSDVVREVTEKVTSLGPNPVRKQPKYYPYAQNDSTSPPPAVNKTDFSAITEEIRGKCKELLESGTVDTVIGYKYCEDTQSGLPCFIDDPTCSADLIWSNRCISYLAGYLLELKGKVAIVAKACDARAVINLTNENQLSRDNVYIIGITCFGMVDSFDVPLSACLECNVGVPPEYDILVDVSLSGSIDHIINNKHDIDTSFNRFLGEINKCILCFGCRQSCYGCYCNTCFIDRNEPDWQTGSPDVGKKMLYHLGRSIHLSGRCVECGACENVCASGVDIRYLIRSVTQYIEKTYDYRTGMDFGTDPAMLTYKPDDVETGFLGHSDPENPDIAGGCHNE